MYAPNELVKYRAIWEITPCGRAARVPSDKPLNRHHSCPKKRDLQMLNQIGRYKINKVLGSGGMATVYLANDPFIERQVAIKLMAHQLAHDDKLRQRFYQEAKVIAALENPNIVKIYDFGEQDGQPFLVMPYLTGGSLRERLQQRGQQNQP